ncbi:hypothetical protein ACFE04_002114 [Oxalis oulophora]
MPVLIVSFVTRGYLFSVFFVVVLVTLKAIALCVSKWLRGVDGGALSKGIGTSSGLPGAPVISANIGYNSFITHNDGPADYFMDHVVEEDPIGNIDAKKRPSQDDIFLRLSTCSMSLQAWSKDRKLKVGADLQKLDANLSLCRDSIGSSQRADLEYLNARKALQV